MCARLFYININLFVFTVFITNAENSEHNADNNTEGNVEAQCEDDWDDLLNWHDGEMGDEKDEIEDLCDKLSLQSGW